MALTTEQLVAMLNSGTAQSQSNYGAATGGALSGVSAEQYAAIPDWVKTVRPQDVSGTFTPMAPTPAPTATPTTATPTTTNFVSPTGQLNVPYGAAFFEPNLQAYTTLAGQKESGRQFDAGQAQQQGQFDATMGMNAGQFNVNTLLNAAKALASLFASGPESAAELAFLQGGMGFPAIGGSRPAVEDLIGASTRGATGMVPLNFPGGQGVNIPNTLGGQQLQALTGNRNLAGVLGSFAKAAGNPDLFARSVAALIPSNYRPSGTPQFAYGGFTNAPQMVVGDPQRAGVPNPETILNPTNAPIAVIPHYAEGTGRVDAGMWLKFLQENGGTPAQIRQANEMLALDAQQQRALVGQSEVPFNPPSGHAAPRDPTYMGEMYAGDPAPYREAAPPDYSRAAPYDYAEYEEYAPAERAPAAGYSGETYGGDQPGAAPEIAALIDEITAQEGPVYVRRELADTNSPLFNAILRLRRARPPRIPKPPGWWE